MVRSHDGEPDHLGVAQWAAHVLREHGVAGSRPATETKMRVRLGVAVAQLAEPRIVTPLTPVRLRTHPDVPVSRIAATR